MAVDLGSPQDWQQGAGAFKNAIDAIRSVVELLKPFGSGGKKPTAEEQAMIDKAVAQAEKAAKVVDAQTAKALGYTLWAPRKIQTASDQAVWLGRKES